MKMEMFQVESMPHILHTIFQTASHEVWLIRFRKRNKHFVRLLWLLFMEHFSSTWAYYFCKAFQCTYCVIGLNNHYIRWSGNSQISIVSSMLYMLDIQRQIWYNKGDKCHFLAYSTIFFLSSYCILFYSIIFLP